MTNDELFYDPEMDDKDEKWVNKQREMNATLGNFCVWSIQHFQPNLHSKMFAFITIAFNQLIPSLQHGNNVFVGLSNYKQMLDNF